MIQIDLITGFLGSGKTTFLKKYAGFWIRQNVKIGILENDYGAVNVDVMLLSDPELSDCVVESVAGACDRDCHMRRFKTKLIALAMSGCERVIIEPSGIFDTDEFFDSLREEPLDRWYTIGNVIAVVDAGLEKKLSAFSEYMLASQCANAGRIILSKTQLYSEECVQQTVQRIQTSLRDCGCSREIAPCMLTKNWDALTNEDWKLIAECGYSKAGFVKKYRDAEGFSSLYFMHTGLDRVKAAEKTKELLRGAGYGDVFRVKGFVMENGCWYELNGAASGIMIRPSGTGQDILIVIGENLNKSAIEAVFGGNENG